MTTLLWILLSALLSGAGALLLASLLLLVPAVRRRALVPWLVSYATGTLLASAFLGLIPRALDHAPSSPVLSAVLAGVLFFFLLEKMVLWHHCHEPDCENLEAVGPLLLIGDGIHNLVDGAIIAIAFLSSVPMGIGVTISVIAHEIPQEVGDFAVLLDSGYSRARALLFNLLSSLCAVVGALLTYGFLRHAHALLPYLMALGAASFLYIAMADLVPSLHRRRATGQAVRQFAVMLLGVGTVLGIHSIGAE